MLRRGTGTGTIVTRPCSERRRRTSRLIRFFYPHTAASLIARNNEFCLRVQVFACYRN
jgi:hypothetical protein